MTARDYLAVLLCVGVIVAGFAIVLLQAIAHALEQLGRSV